MIAPQAGERGLVAWAFATFHASGFVLPIVLILYSRDALGPALAGLNTLLGLGLFLALWVTTCLTTAQALRGLDPMSGDPEGQRYARRALRWGAANGMAFLAIAGAVLIANSIVTAPPDRPVGSIFLTAVFLGPFALVISAVVGAGVGTIFGIIDLGLCALARLCVRAPARS